MATAEPLTPLSSDERAVIARTVDTAPPLTAAKAAELSALFGVTR